MSGELEREVGISVRDVHKRYGVVPALQGLSLQVRAGEVCGLVGPNGAGKTSTLRALAGIIRVDAGEVRVCGRPAGPEHPETRRLVGVIPETPQLYEDLTALENLHFFSRAHGLRPSKRQLGDALDRQGVAPLADRVAGTLSKGQKCSWDSSSSPGRSGWSPGPSSPPAQQPFWSQPVSCSCS